MAENGRPEMSPAPLPASRWEAAVFDAVMGVVERTLLPGARARLLASADGDVLEVAAGTGLNVGHYPTACRLTLTDQNPSMLAIARKRVPALEHPVAFAVADAEDLPFPDVHQIQNHLKN